MEVDEVSIKDTGDSKFCDVDMLYRRKSYFAPEDFEPDTETFEMIKENIWVLVIGAGGLGCELLKDLALSGIA